MNVIFVTTELPPLPAGGAGYLVARLRALFEGAGHRVRVVVAADGVVADPAVRVVGWGADHGQRSRSVAEAVSELVAEEGADLVEFQDVYGLGFEALAHRSRYGLEATPLAVRFHGTMGAFVAAVGHSPPDADVVTAMERHALRMADAVIVPSPAMAGFVEGFYAIDADRLVVGEPARATDTVWAPYAPGPRPQLVMYGKRSEVKGALQFADAAIQLMRRRPELEVRFVGGDEWGYAQDRSVTTIIEERLGELSARVSFEPMPSPSQLAAALAGAWLVVVPSIFETYCLAAHEVRASGLPLLVADIDAFRDILDEATGAARYDGSVAGLVATAGDLLDDPERLATLAAAPLPEYDDPLAAYLSGLPAVRHPQAQSGLATIAVHAVEQVSARPATRTTAGSIARRLLRALPRPVAALAVKVLPQSLKDRFRTMASWPQEEARRARRQRHRRAEAMGRSRPAVASPEVSVVIPCFEQGEWLRDAIASVYEQDHDSWEIVVVDDGSTDVATIAAVDAVGTFHRVTVVRQGNKGLPAARNAGCAAARGAYLVPLDADDELAPGFLPAMLARLRDDDAVGFVHCWAEMFGDVRELWATRPFNLYQELVSNSVVGCVALRREAWEAAGGYDETMRAGNEDWELWVRLSLAGWKQEQVRRPLFRYRRLGASMSAHTEARFEAGRAEIAARNPDAYAPDALRAMKRGWYPAVSLLVAASDRPPPRHELDDCEVIVIGGEPSPAVENRAREMGWPLRRADDVGSAVVASRGKYLSDESAVEWANGAALSRAVATLEADPASHSVLSGGSAVLWRRWAVIDGGSPHGRAVTLDGLGAPAGGGSLARGAFPDPAWDLPGELPSDLPVHRQSPEVDASPLAIL